MKCEVLVEVWRATLAKWEEHAFSWLKNLVSINSFSKNFEGVRTVGQATAQMFRLLDFEVYRFASDEPRGAPHLVLRRKGNSSLHIVLVSHLDTVYSPEEERENQFRWREEGERIYGPGIADIKGGTVTAYLALLGIRETCPLLWEDINWTILLNAQEELGSFTFPPLAREFAQGGTACLVYEFSEERPGLVRELVTARKGAARFFLEVFGREAHSGSAHEKGANAVWQLARVVDYLQSLTDYEKGITLNVGSFHGGVAVNRVPDYACAEVDLRTFSQEDYEEVRAKILSLQGEGDVKSHKGEVPCRIQVKELSGYSPWPLNDASESFANLVGEVADSLGQKVKRVRKHGSSDGCFLWDVLPTLDGFGPLGGNIHCSRRVEEEGIEQEYILRSSLLESSLLSMGVFYHLWSRGGVL